MKIETVVVGNLQTNCYIVTNKENEIIIIDPGDEVNKIESVINNRLVKGILITHSHFDHIGALKPLEDKYKIKHNNFIIDNFDFEVIETPGHYYDLKTFYFKEEKIMFTGDFLFKGTCGRVDLQGSSVEDMKNSLIKIKKYPEYITIYPGHGEKSTLKEEKNIIDLYINYFSDN